ncbi:hypothetical protein [Flindersiella endophytica]
MNVVRTISRWTGIVALGALMLGSVTAGPASAGPSMLQWSEVDSGVPDGILYDIDSRAGATWTVGLYETPGEHGEGDWHPLALYRESGEWVKTAQPFDDGRLLDVSVAGTDDVWAVGEAGQVTPRPLLQHWNGRRWQVVRNPSLPPGSYGEFTAVAVGGQDVWVAGWVADSTEARNVVYRYANGRWQPFEVSGMAYPYKIEAVTGNDVWLAGGGLWHFDGRQWEAAEIPRQDEPGALPMVMTVSAAGPHDVWAVGEREDPKLGRRPLVLHYDGQAWSEFQSPADTAELNSVSMVDGVPLAVGNHPIAWEPYTLMGEGQAFVRADDPAGAGVLTASVTVGHELWVVGATGHPGELHHPYIAVGTVAAKSSAAQGS